jgi:hypothetical protein
VVAVTFCEKTRTPLFFHTWAVYEVAPVEALQSRVGVRVVTVVPGDGIPPGARGVGLAGVVNEACVVNVHWPEYGPTMSVAPELLKACTSQ